MRARRRGPQQAAEEDALVYLSTVLAGLRVRPLGGQLRRRRYQAGECLRGGVYQLRTAPVPGTPRGERVVDAFGVPAHEGIPQPPAPGQDPVGLASLPLVTIRPGGQRGEQRLARGHEPLQGGPVPAQVALQRRKTGRPAVDLRGTHATSPVASPSRPRRRSSRSQAARWAPSASSKLDVVASSSNWRRTASSAPGRAPKAWTARRTASSASSAISSTSPYATARSADTADPPSSTCRARLSPIWLTRRCIAIPGQGSRSSRAAVRRKSAVAMR